MAGVVGPTIAISGSILKLKHLGAALLAKPPKTVWDKSRNVAGTTCTQLYTIQCLALLVFCLSVRSQKRRVKIEIVQ